MSEKGPVLDLGIVLKARTMYSGVKWKMMFDHYLVDITVNQKHSQIKNVIKTSRKFRKLVADDFFQDLQNLKSSPNRVT